MEWAMGKGKSVTVINVVEEGERGGDTPHVRMRDGMVLHWLDIFFMALFPILQPVNFHPFNQHIFASSTE